VPETVRGDIGWAGGRDGGMIHLRCDVVEGRWWTDRRERDCTEWRVERIADATYNLQDRETRDRDE